MALNSNSLRQPTREEHDNHLRMVSKGPRDGEKAPHPIHSRTEPLGEPKLEDGSPIPMPTHEEAAKRHAEYHNRQQRARDPAKPERAPDGDFRKQTVTPPNA